MADACSSCGAALDPDDPACALCGTPADALGAAAPCPRCDHRPPVGSRYCNACGLELGDARPDPVAQPVVVPPETSSRRPSSAAGRRGLAVVGVGALLVVGLYGLTVWSSRPAPSSELDDPDTDALGVGPASPIPTDTPPLPDSLQTAADAFAAENTADGWYESGRYYLTAAFGAVQADPQSSVQWARRAVADFDKSLALADDPRVRVALAEAATFDPSDPMRPVQELQAVLAVEPDNLDALFLLGERRLMIGRTGPAREAFERILEVAPGRQPAPPAGPSGAGRRPGRVTARLAVALVLVGGCGDAPDVVVFAAASTTDVVEAVARQVEAETGRSVAVSVGASSVLARQIARGAPADVYVTADSAWVGWLAARGVAVRQRRVVAGGRLVVVGPAGSRVADLRSALAGRVALADPAHVPAGQYARRALEARGLWDDVAPRVVAAGDVRGALAAVQTGAADRAVVYATDAAKAGGVAVVWRLPPSPAVRFEVAQITESGSGVFAALARPDGWTAAGFEPVR